MKTKDLIVKSNVKALCTTDDLIDTLEYHIKLKEDESFNVKVLPAVRPDKGLDICKDTFLPWVQKLSKICNKPIKTYDEFLKAIEERIEFFNSVGCKVADHGFNSISYIETSKEEAKAIFNKALKEETLTKEEEIKYQTYTLKFFGKLYAKLGWAMQLHIGALRNNNTRMFNEVGVDAGFDSINDEKVAYPLSRILDSLDKENSLPKTILYTLNPKDNYVLSTMLGNFQGTEIPGKVQFGSAWWFLDNKEGMIEQMKVLANTGLLSRFVGMLTDSRSFTSYTRHEYFRRIICNLIGEWVCNGEIPDDLEFLGEVVKGICFNNANNYFDLNC